VSSAYLLGLASFLASVACAPASPGRSAPTTDEPPSGAPAVSVSASTPEARLPATSDPTSSDTLAFDWKGADPSVGESFYELPIELEVGERTCRFYRDDGRREKHLECVDQGGARLWGYDLGPSSMDDAALASDGATLFAVEFSNVSTGATAAAYDLASGERRWTVPVHGLGPVTHSEYLNEAQIRVVGAGSRFVDVLGWESSGRYVERLDESTGERQVTLQMLPSGETKRVGRMPESPEPKLPTLSAASHPFTWDSSPSANDSTRAKVIAPGGWACSFDASTRPRTLRFVCEGGEKQRFGFDLGDTGGEGGALAADEARVYLVRFGLITSGATVTAYDFGTGRRAWERRLIGLGPIDHSKYSNRVQARVARGQLTVFGWEAAGKYVEVLDTRTGRALGNRTEPVP
jgi:outer membrane protein assembly factor BamB